MRAPGPTAPVRRGLFVATVLAGSFLLFIVQPMVARLALPRLGGAPAVWNSAMLVYQALLLGGYAYAHWLSRWPVPRQAAIHLVLLALAATTLPIHLAALPPPAPGREAWWVPALFVASIGPVFLLVSAQAPLMQRWFAAHPQAGEPWALYSASNLGSFAGLIAYPALAEPLLPVRVQAWAWSVGYIVLMGLVAATALARRGLPDRPPAEPSATGPSAAEPEKPVTARRIVLWLALSAVPSGLMLSTTTHLTTDIFAMPLLWVIPLGLYLLSFVAAFADRRDFANAITRAAPPIVLLGGGMAMVSRSSGSLTLALVGLVVLFVVAVALHARLYALRPSPGRLTLFYLVTAAGGALGGAFTALAAPLLFDWVWEHPLLVVAAALLLPQRPFLGWMRLEGLTPAMITATVAALVVFAGFLGWIMYGLDPREDRLLILALALALAFCGLMALGRRWGFVAVLLVTMVARGGFETLETSLAGTRSRSYFGIYTIRDQPEAHQRMLAHGTTLHGMQYTDARRLRPTTYYGETSGVGIALARAPDLFGPAPRIGVVGLGTGTLACWKRPGQRWSFFEIDRAVLELSRARKFTFLPDCAPDAAVHLGDARIELARLPARSFDLLAIDAFSSDAIPLHLLTAEALAVYTRALDRDGLLLIHISNRYFELEPQLSASLGRLGWAARVLTDTPPASEPGLSASVWVAAAPRAAQLVALTAGRDDWVPLLTDKGTRPWTDDHASILPALRWANLLGKLP